MDFSLSEDQKMFRDLFDEFAEKEVAKASEETDREEKPPLDLLKKAAAQGFLGGPIPEQYGGAALDGVSETLLVEAFARHCLSTALTLSVHSSLASMTVLLAGDDEQKERFLPLLASGEAIGSLLLTEPEAGTDIRALQTTAAREGDGYRLNGLKTWALNAGIAGLHVVAAKTESGASMFAVEMGTPGLTIGYREPTLGLRGLTVNTVYLEDCLVPADHLLGDEGAGWEIVARVTDRWRIALAAAALGAAEGALDLGLRFAVERKQFGVPIAQKGAIQGYLAEAAMEIESLRHLVHHAAWLCDSGQPYSREASMAKYKGGVVAKNTTDKMLQVHGGYGFSDEYAISRYYRDARALRILGGADEYQRTLIAAPELEKHGLHAQT